MRGIVTTTQNRERPGDFSAEHGHAQAKRYYADYSISIIIVVARSCRPTEEISVGGWRVEVGDFKGASQIRVAMDCL